MPKSSGKDGRPPIPAGIKRPRRLLRSERAEIVRHEPFAIQLPDRKDGGCHPVESKCGTGERHIGNSLGTAKREGVSAQYDLLPGEPEQQGEEQCTAEPLEKT